MKMIFLPFLRSRTSGRIGIIGLPKHMRTPTILFKIPKHEANGNLPQGMMQLNFDGAPKAT